MTSWSSMRSESGANAILAMRYDANEITDGITEVLAYGTAVQSSSRCLTDPRIASLASRVAAM